MLEHAKPLNVFRRAILWLAYQLIWLALPSVVLGHAIFSVLKVDPTPHTSDQKRQWVHAKLRQQFPALSKRAVSLAVEAAVKRVL